MSVSFFRTCALTAVLGALGLLLGTQSSCASGGEDTAVPDGGSGGSTSGGSGGGNSGSGGSGGGNSGSGGSGGGNSGSGGGNSGSGGGSSGGDSGGGSSGGGSGGGSSGLLPDGCAPDGLVFDCNPIDNIPCPANGYACDLGTNNNMDGAFCYPPPNQAPNGDPCDVKDGPYCSPTLHCDTSGGGTSGSCKTFCCSKGDCPSDKTCEPLYNTGTLGVCN